MMVNLLFRTSDRCLHWVLLPVLLLSGCADGRQIVYPHGYGRGFPKKHVRSNLGRPPRVEVRIEDQGKTMPPMLGE